MYKYNPDDFPDDISEGMRKVYDLYEANKQYDKRGELYAAYENLYYDLKDLRTFNIKPAEEVVEMQYYFRSLLYD